jgi:formate hydrogenlyase transcriptional activator
MYYKDKTKEQPINKSAKPHQPIKELQARETLRRQADEALKRSEIRYRRLFETAQDGILLLDADSGQILDVNPFLLKMLGYSHKDFLGKKLWEIGSFSDTAASKLHFSELQAKGYVRYEHLPLETSDGRLIDVEFVSNVYLVDQEKIIQCNVRDITLRKQAEEALRKAYDEMDMRVKERTEDLAEANRQLLREIEEHEKTEESLRGTLIEIRELKSKLREENLYLLEEIGLIHSHKDIVGNSEAIRTVLKQIEQVAPTDSTVLIQGETGTGKELVAHTIHNLSGRKGRLMIKVNCAALPPTLIESELFGREKGAFTGALSKQLGRFELADASTIFLDEIDALPLELQAKLLRVLESGEFERLGSPRTVKVDVRIISATNRDLAGVVGEGGFREDLYYRLNVFQIIVPPLRERPEDMLPLVWSFVQEFGKRMGKRIESIPQKDVEALQVYPWPGNVRELRNVTERAMIITTGPVLHLDAPKMIAKPGAEQSGTLEEVEKRRIIEALNTTDWRVSGKGGSAEILGINPKTLESRMQRLRIHRNKKNT